jgi:outer membrane protein assembly factor BamB
MARRFLVACGVLMACVAGPRGQNAAPAAAADWPQWRGPSRSAISPETGLLRSWPAAGPPRAWSTSNLGAGFGSIAVSRDRIFVQGMRNFQSVVSALNRADGTLVWAKPIGRAGDNDRGPGPRGTPTVDGDRTYVLTENGDLASLRIQDGGIVWQRNILQEFGGRNIDWLISESPLIDGNNVIISPGGRSAGMAALDKSTGKTVWVSKELSDRAATPLPSSPTCRASAPS